MSKKSLSRIGLLFASLAGAGTLAATTPSGTKVLIALARGTNLVLFPGQYNPQQKKWLSDRKAFKPPPPEAPITLYGVSGKIGEVRLADVYKVAPDEMLWTWHPGITNWDRSTTQVALALFGTWPDTSRHAQPLSLEDPDALAAATAYLKQHRLHVTHPRLIQVLRVDLDGDGRDETVFSARTDPTALNDKAIVDFYSLTLVRAEVGGQTAILPLQTQTFHKAAHMTLDECERLYGRMATYQILGFADITQEDRLQVAIVNDNRQEGPETDVFDFTGKRMDHVLSSSPTYF